ncbi:MAG: hypothetical protein ACHQ52_05870 [Candidatus Eisenbacteria bacterium]
MAGPTNGFHFDNPGRGDDTLAFMLRTRTGSTGRLIQLCLGYFVTYVATGVLVKVFTGGIRQPRMSEVAYLFNNTFGSSLLCVAVVVLFGWLRLKSARTIRVLGLELPSEVLYIVPSGVCTAIVIPATTMLYLLPISVMVAMVIMRGCVIVIGRAVDAIQIRQGILHRKVYAEENWAVVFALLAVSSQVLLIPVAGYLARRGVDVGHVLGMTPKAIAGGFDFVHNATAMTILTSYVVAYAVRIYIMNYFKNTRPPGVEQDNRGFFAVEQITASLVMVVVGFLVVQGPVWFGWTNPQVVEFRAAALHPDPAALISGVPWAMVAFFSVFLFMFQGRTATFAGLVNRLTSLLAGTTATVLLAWWFGLKPPAIPDWVSLAFILVAVGFLTRAEQKRVAGR